MQTARAIGFDNGRYLAAQTKAIQERVDRCKGRLYIEFGGKLLLDHHAARVLPGFDPDVKLRPLLELRADVEILFVVNARDVQRGRIRGDFGLTYDLATLRTLDDLRDRGLPISTVVITRFAEQPEAIRLRDRLAARDVNVHLHRDVPGYPDQPEVVASPAGFGTNSYIEAHKRIVVVAGAGPGSGKIETALHQIWHELRQGRVAGFAKWETFPVWDLPIEHPVNLAYEAATADLWDRNQIDPFHLDAYGVEAVNYNRDVEHFPVLRALLEQIMAAGGAVPHYRSPTDMGVNCVSEGIVDDAVVCDASRQELVRRFFRYQWEHQLLAERKETVEIARTLMARAGVSVADREVVHFARRVAYPTLGVAQAEHQVPGGGAALALPGGEVATGRGSELLSPPAAAVVNALKIMAGIPDAIHLLSPMAVQNLAWLRERAYLERGPKLDIVDALRALSVSAPHNPAADAALQCVPVLSQCEMHTTRAPSLADQSTLRQLGLMFTTDGD